MINTAYLMLHLFGLENAQGLLTSLQEDYEIVVRAGTYTSFDSDAIKQIVAKVGDNGIILIYHM